MYGRADGMPSSHDLLAVCARDAAGWQYIQLSKLVSQGLGLRKPCELGIRKFVIAVLAASISSIRRPALEFEKAEMMRCGGIWLGVNASTGGVKVLEVSAETDPGCGRIVRQCLRTRVRAEKICICQLAKNFWQRLCLE